MMKRIVIRVLGILVAAVMLLVCVPGCSNERTKAVMEMDGVSSGADVYRYWLSTFKYYFV